MAAGSSKRFASPTSVYQNVIDDVIKNVREEFLNEAVDLEILEDLKRIWLNKLSLSGAVNRPSQPDPPPKPAPSDSKPSPRNSAQSSASKSSNPPVLPPPLIPVHPQRQPPSLIPSRDAEHHSSVIHTASSHSQTTASASSSSSVQSQASIILHPGLIQSVGESRSTSTVSQAMPTLLQPPLSAFQQGMVPIQTPQGTVLVPLTHLMALQKQAAAVTQGTKSSTQDKDVQQIDGYPPLPAIQQGGKSEDSENMCSQQEVMFTLPTKFLEVDETFVQESPTKGNVLQCRKTKCARFPKPGDTVEFEVIEQLDGLPTCKNIKTKPRRGFIAQLDGGDSSSEEDSDLDDDSSEDDIGGTDESLHQPVEDEDPLNSDDDVDDDDVSEQKDFETNDTIVCLWEKVYRVRTKWKFLLKDGIMHLGGFDYVFQKGTGEADW